MTSPNDALLEQISRVHNAILQWRSQLPELHMTLTVQVPKYVGTYEERKAAVDTLAAALGVKPGLELWPSGDWYYVSESKTSPRVGAYTLVADFPLPQQGVETAENTEAVRVVSAP